MKTFLIDAEIAAESADVNYFGFRYRTIGPNAVTEFLNSLEPGEKAEILINSPGGSVMAGLAIANSIKNSKADITCHVIGLAASMASVIACAGHKVVMEEGAFLMIHDPWAYTEGDADDMRKMADTLDVIKDGILAFYRAKFPTLSGDELSALMSEETWLTGQAAKDAGFDCEVVPASIRAAACVAPRRFASLPDAAAKFLNVLDKPADPATASAAPTPQPDWEARYRGLSQKLNEINAAHERAMVELGDKFAAEKAQLQATIDSLSDDLCNRTRDLDAANAALNTAKTDAEQTRQALALLGEQHDRLKSAHAALTAGVLTPSSSAKPLHGKALIRSKN